MFPEVDKNRMWNVSVVLYIAYNLRKEARKQIRDGQNTLIPIVIRVKKQQSKRGISPISNNHGRVAKKGHKTTYKLKRKGM